jgi:Tol biopolymer transport system component
LAVAVIAAALAAVVALVLTRRPAEIRLGRRLQLTLSPGLELDPALSPDGKFVAFTAGPLSRTRLYVRQVDGGTPVAITADTTGFARMPRWSPDGQRLVFSSERGIELVPAFGGVAVSRDGREIAYHTFRNGLRQLFVMGVEGGTPVQVTHDSAQNRIASWSPDGRALVFQRDAFAPSAASEIVTRDSGGNWGTPRILLKGGDIPVWSPDGRRVLTVVKDGDRSTLMIVPRAGGAPSQVVLPQGASPTPGLIWAWSPDGRFLYYVGQNPADQKTGVWRVPVSGGTPRLTLWFDEPSPNLIRPWLKVNGNRFYLTRGDQQSDVWMTEVLRSR